MTLTWEDYRLLLAVARGRSATRAAEQLGVTTSTVTRRLERLREDTGTAFFDGMGGALQPTRSGEVALRAAKAMEQAVLQAERGLQTIDAPIDGVLTVTTSQTIYSYLLRPGLGQLAQAHPGLQLDVRVTDELESLARGDADVAIRTHAAPSDALVGLRVGTVAYRVYGAERYFAQHEPGTPHRYVTWTHQDEPAWLKQYAPDAVRGLRVATHRGIIEAVLDGHGLGILPVFVGTHEPTLRPLKVSEPSSQLDLWVLTHPQLRDSARVKAFFDVVGRDLRARAKAG